MPNLKVIKLLLMFGAIVFIAKPFMGFNSCRLFKDSKKKSIIWVKAFTKRLPEYLEEAEIKKAAIKQLLNNPPASLLLTITTLLSLLFPLIYHIRKNITGRFINQLSINSLQDEHTYLLTGKLII